MDDNKSKPWTEWLNTLVPEDSWAFLSKLHKVKLKARQRIFQQGECDNRLIFIESGKLKLSYWDSVKKRNTVFSHLSNGDIYGVETFFSHSPHTGTLSAVEDSMIRCLYKNDYQKLLAENPAFEKKLVEYCEKNQKKIVFQDPQKLAGRVHERYPTSLKGVIQRIDSSGTISPPALSVTVSNISVGGVCCSSKNLGVEDAANFYKSQVQITISYQKDSLNSDIQKTAKVVAVRFLPSGESTIHLQFNAPLSEKKLMEMMQRTNVYIYQ